LYDHQPQGRSQRRQDLSGARPDGQPHKTEINDQKAQSGGGREGRLKKHIAEKKTEEYKEYSQQIGALAKQYTTPNPERLMQAKQQGNLSLQCPRTLGELTVCTRCAPP
jgi:hypothetical protein